MTQITSTSSGGPLGPAPQVEFRLSIRAEVAPHEPIVHRDQESLDFIPITGGQVTGAIEGTVVPGGGDWCLVRADGGYNVEARYGIRTTSGVYIDVVNTGVLRHLPGDTGDAQQMGYFMTTPSFRTTDGHLQWLTRSLFVGRARVHEDHTAIDVYEILAAPVA